jgi:hypothetical protein
MAGLMAFSRPEVQAALKLTDAQQEKLKELGQEMREKMQGLFDPNGDRQEQMKKMTELRKESVKKAEELLTADQKKEWMELLGAPFEFKPDPPAV